MTDIYKAYENNALYQLIRRRAGTKMLRDAEGIIAYDIIDTYLSEEYTDKACEIAETFHNSYPLLKNEEPMTVIMLEEILLINPKELEQLPWVYVDMLRTLTWNDPDAGALLNEMLQSSPAAAWRLPLDTTVPNEFAFKKTIDDWWTNNGSLVVNVNSWALGIPPTEADKVSIQPVWGSTQDRAELRDCYTQTVSDYGHYNGWGSEADEFLASEQAAETAVLTKPPATPTGVTSHDDSIERIVTEMCAETEFGAYR